MACKNRQEITWINYLGTQDFFPLISNTSGGYCFYKDARLRRITRYRYNNVPVDNGGRYFYIYDDGDYWSPGWKPVKKELDRYECRHGLGYTRILGERNGISADMLFFVPLDYNGEVQKVVIKNTGRENKNITLFSFIEFCLWNAYHDMTNFQRNFSTGKAVGGGLRQGDAREPSPRRKPPPYIFLNRQLYYKFRPFPGFAVHLQIPIIHVYDMLDYG